MKSLPLLVSLPNESASLDFLARELDWNTETTAAAAQLFAKGLPPLVDRGTLPFILGVSRRLVAVMGRFSEKHYRIFEIPKSGGGVRQIEAPRRFLKVIQRWIHDHTLLSWSPPDSVMGFVKGRNIFGNGASHASSLNLMVVDVEDFFPTIGEQSVKEAYSLFGFPEPVCDQLAALSTFEGRLPQGAPTSPALSNIVFERADRELQALAEGWTCNYSRYADDLAFSGSIKFQREHMSSVEGVLRKYGFRMNTSKSRIVGQGARQVVAGLVVNRSVLPPREVRRRWRAIFHQAGGNPANFQERAASLSGIASFVHTYDPGLAREYREVAEAALALE